MDPELEHDRTGDDADYAATGSAAGGDMQDPNDDSYFEEDADGVDAVPELSEAELQEQHLRELEHYAFPKAMEPDEDRTGKLAFIHACRKIHQTSFMKFPIDSIVEKFDQERLCLDHGGIGDKGAEALAETIRVNQSISELSLVDNWITPKGSEFIIGSLINSKSVRRVDFSENRLGCQTIDYNAGQQIRSLVIKNSLITELVLRANKLTCKDVEQIAEGVIENVTLQSLDLSYNEINYRGAVAIAKILSHNSELREINLEWNKFRTQGSFLILNEGLNINNTIKRFNLAWNGIDDEGGVVVGKIIGENAIEEIVVSHNRIGLKGAEAIAKGIKSSSALAVLVLDDNPLKDDGCVAIIRALRENATLTRVSLLQTGIGRKGVEETSETLRVRQKLKIAIPEGFAPK